MLTEVDTEGSDPQRECRRMRGIDWVGLCGSLAGIGAVSVTAREAEAFRAFGLRRRSVVERNKELRDVCLRWLHEEIESRVSRSPATSARLSASVGHVGAAGSIPQSSTEHGADPFTLAGVHLPHPSHDDGPATVAAPSDRGFMATVRFRGRQLRDGNRECKQCSASHGAIAPLALASMGR